MINDENRKAFEHAGRIHVQRLIAGGYFNKERRDQAYEWLDEQAHGPQMVPMAEQARVARSANRAAWTAAITAIFAAIIATLSIPNVLPWLSGLISWAFSR